jgi:hypothetical protein
LRTPSSALPVSRCFLVLTSVLSLLFQSRNLVGMELGPGRRRSDLPAADERIHALRASFWVAAYSVSTQLRHVKGAEGRPSGEEIYGICKKRAFDRYGSFVSYDGESEALGVEKPSMAKESNFKYKMLSGLLNTLQKDFKQDKFDSLSTAPIASPVASLIVQIADLKATPTAGSNMDMHVNFDHVDFEPPEKYYSMYLNERFPGWSKVVVPAKSEYDTEGIETYEANRSDLSATTDSDPLPEAYMTKDFDTFKNNCRVNERSRLNDEGWSDNKHNEKILELKRQSDAENNDVDAFEMNSSSSGAVVVQEWEKHASIDKLVEGALLKAHRTLILQLAATSYQSENQDHLLLRLDEFLKSSKNSPSYSKGENRNYAPRNDFCSLLLELVNFLLYIGVLIIHNFLH